MPSTPSSASAMGGTWGVAFALELTTVAVPRDDEVAENRLRGDHRLYARMIRAMVGLTF